MWIDGGFLNRVVVRIEYDSVYKRVLLFLRGY